MINFRFDWKEYVWYVGMAMALGACVLMLFSGVRLMMRLLYIVAEREDGEEDERLDDGEKGYSQLAYSEVARQNIISKIFNRSEGESEDECVFPLSGKTMDSGVVERETT